MRNIKLYLQTKKPFNPILKIKYGVGLGDFITAILHSKFIGPITYLITGQMEPCHKCNSRRVALNVLFPIPIWRLFFKTSCERDNSITEEYGTHGITFVDAHTVMPSLSAIPITEITRMSMDDLMNSKLG